MIANVGEGVQSHSHTIAAAAAAKSLLSCPTLCNPIDGSPPGSPIPGILQARTLEWVAISFSNAWKWKVKVKSLSHSWLLATPWTAAYQAPPSMGFSRQEYWSGVPLPSPIQSLITIKNMSMLSNPNSFDYRNIHYMFIGANVSWWKYHEIFTILTLFIISKGDTKIKGFLYGTRASLVAQLVKNLPAMWETSVRSLD